VPSAIDDLKHHGCLVGTNSSWHFVEEGRTRTFAPEARWRCNSGKAVADAAAADLGICQLPLFYVRQQIADGVLLPVLQDFRAAPEPIWVVYPKRRHLLSKVRNLADELVAKLQVAFDAA
jgi:DNA-binding transcriptional LysR family regulator